MKPSERILEIRTGLIEMLAQKPQGDWLFMTDQEKEDKFVEAGLIAIGKYLDEQAEADNGR